MLKKFFKLILLFGLSTVLAYLVRPNQEKLLTFWGQLSAGQHEYQANQSADTLIQSGTSNRITNQQSVAKKPAGTSVDSDQLAELEISPEENNQCITTPVEAVTVKKKSLVYRWKDDNGIIHFGDSPFQQVAVENVNLKRSDELEYFNLNMTGNEQPTHFSDQLSIRISKVYQLLSDLVPKDKLEKVTVDLKIFNNHNDYLRYSTRFSKTLGRRSNGFYVKRLNQAVVNKRNAFQAGQVALHESTHVINAGIFGNIPRWLNEGIAEYTENMTLTGQVTEIHPNTSWSRFSKVKTKRIVSFDELFSAKRRDWGGSKRLSYYATSWSLIYFLMETEEDRQWLGKLLTEKASKRCEKIITHRYIDNFYPGGIANLQQRFNKWLGLASKLSTHRY